MIFKSGTIRQKIYYPQNWISTVWEKSGESFLWRFNSVEIQFCGDSIFVPDEKFSSVTMRWTWSCSLFGVCCCLFKTFSYLLNQTSEFYETLLVLFVCQWELVYQFSEKFINFYYPLPFIFVVIFYWTLTIYIGRG